jgi:hypothetical protein
MFDFLWSIEKSNDWHDLTGFADDALFEGVPDVFAVHAENRVFERKRDDPFGVSHREISFLSFLCGFRFFFDAIRR